MTLTICICGAGTMGSGIAQLAAQSGFNTILFDVNVLAIDKAKVSIEKNLQYTLQIEKVETGELGIKSGKGFYKYPNKKI